MLEKKVVRVKMTHTTLMRLVDKMSTNLQKTNSYTKRRFKQWKRQLLVKMSVISVACICQHRDTSLPCVMRLVVEAQAFHYRCPVAVVVIPRSRWRHSSESRRRTSEKAS